MHFSVLFKFCPVCGSNDFKQNNVKSKRCNKCEFVYYQNPSAAVAAFIEVDKNLLICIRGKDPAKGTWDLPGGFIDENETAESAIRRELLEELGAKITSEKYLFSLPNVYEYCGMSIPTLDIFYHCSFEKKGNLQAADDVADFMFVPLDQINPERFGLSSIRKAVALFLKRKT